MVWAPALDDFRAFAAQIPFRSNQVNRLLPRPTGDIDGSVQTGHPGWMSLERWAGAASELPTIRSEWRVTTRIVQRGRSAFSAIANTAFDTLAFRGSRLNGATLIEQVDVRPHGP